MSSIEKAINKLVNTATGKQVAKVPSERGGLDKPVTYGEKLFNGESSSGYMELDLDMLAEAGLVVPGAVGKSVDEYRNIKQPLLRNCFNTAVDNGVNANIISITSAQPNEGKTFTALNLAMSIAMELDRTVLLVDADLAKRGVSDGLGIPAGKGLTDVLLDDDIELSDVLLKTNVPKLTLLSGGTYNGNVTEIFSSARMTDLINELAERYPDRVIIIDSPPMLYTSEARVLVNLVGQVLLVVEAEKTLQSQVLEAVELIDKNKIVGFVLNKALQGASQTGYGYGYGYGSYQAGKKPG